MSLNKYDDMMSKESDVSAVVPAAGIPSDNKYDSMVDLDKSSQASNVQASMNYALEKEPSRMAKAMKMAKEVGLDVGTVERNLETVEKKKSLYGVNYQAMVDETPGVAQFMETPENAALGRDDMEAMGKIDKAARFIPKRDLPNPMVELGRDTGKFGRELHGAGDAGWNSLTSNLMGLRMVFDGADRETIERQAFANKRARQLGDARPEYSKEFNSAMSEEGGDVTKAFKRLVGSYDEWKEGKTLEALQSLVVGDVTLVAETLDFLRHVAVRPKGLAYSVTENAVNALPSMGLGGLGLAAGPGAFVAVPVGIGVGSAITEVGATMNSIMEEKGVDTTDPDQLEAAYRNPQIMSEVRAQALRKGITLGVIDGLSFVVGGKVLKAAGGSATKVEKVIAGAKGTGFEMATEAGGEAASQAAEKMDVRQVDLGSAIQEGFTSLGQAAITQGKQTAVRGEFAVREMFDQDPLKAAHQVVPLADQAIKTLQGAEAMQQLGAAIKETKNLQAVPAKVAELIEASSGGKGSSAVYFQTDDFDNYWKKKGVSPSEKAGEIMGDGGQAYEQAKNTNGIVEIPLEQFASVVGPTEDFEAMLPITRTQADGMTLDEARETMRGLPGMMKQLALEATGVTETTQDEVVNEKIKGIGPRIQQQLVEAGRPIREAKHAAKLVEKSFGTIAKRMGMNAEQFETFISDYLPTVAPSQTAAPQDGTQTLNQEKKKAQFTSKLTQTVEQKMGGSASPEQILGMLREVKPEEMKWSGINEFLKDKPKVTKQELLDYLTANQLQINEVTKDDKAKYNLPNFSTWSQEKGLSAEEAAAEWNTKGELYKEYQALNSSSSKNATSSKTQYGKYKLPGGENYREVLFNLPPRAVVPVSADEIGTIDTWEKSERKSFKQVPKKTIQEDADYIAKKKALAKDIKKESPEMKPKEISKLIDDVMETFSIAGEESITGLQTTPELMKKFVDLRRFYQALRSPYPTEKLYKKEIRGERYLLVETGIPPNTNDPFSGVYFGGSKKNKDGEKYKTVDEALAALPAMIAEEEASNNPENYKSSHWSESNVLAHTRLTDREDSDGNKILHIEEIQSDWHQDGRKKGYKDDSVAQITELPEGYRITEWKGKFNVMSPNDEVMTSGTSSKEEAVSQALTMLNNRTGSVPDAPFRKNWHEFVFKRLVIEAINKGYNKVSWSTGEQNADLYSLAKQVDGVLAKKNADGTYHIRAEKGGSIVQEQESVPESSLEASFGKDLAKQIVEDSGVKMIKGDNKDFSLYDGDNLKVGGEGMKGFYDKMLVDFANKFGKKYGAKVQPMSLDNIASKYPGTTATMSGEVHSLEITPEMQAAAISEGLALFQGRASPVGQIRFGETGINIDLLEGANPSTFLHEMGHAYLKVLSDLSVKNEAPQSIKDDMQTMLAWMGVDSVDKIGVEQHEQFARGFEAYLREGKAPSASLREAFINFKTWLVAWYKSITNLNVNLNDDVRGVFDRLIATEEEIADARGYISSGTNFSVEQPTEKQEKYLAKIADWKVEAEETLAKKLMADMAKKDSQEYKKLEAMTRAIVETEVNQMKIYNLRAYLEKGTKADGTPVDADTPRYRIDKEAIKTNFPKGTLPKLRGMTAEAGGDFSVVDPAVIASMFGYNSSREMIAALSDSPTKDSFIDTMTEQRMQENFSDLMNDEGMMFSEAIKIVHSEKGAQVKRLEFEMIAERAKPTLKEGIRMISHRLPSDKQIKSEAMNIIRQTNQKQVRPITYLRAERKFAKQAGVMFAQGNFEGALDAKRKELYNYELYKAAQQFNDNKIKKLKFFKKILKTKDEDSAKSRDNNIVKATQALIARYTGDPTAKHPSHYLENMRKYNEDSYLAMQSLIDQTMIPKDSFDDMTVDEFTQVADLIQSLWNLSKGSKEIMVGETKMELDTAIDEILVEAEKFRKEGEKKKYNSTATDREKKIVDLMGLKAAFTTFETIADIMGPFYRKYIFTEVSRAEDTRGRMAKEYKKRIVELSKKVREGMDLKKTIISDELNFEFKNIAEVLGALLHTGNESNMKKLLIGREWAVVDEATGEYDVKPFQRFIDRLIDEGQLTKEHFDYIQALWDINEELKPAAQKAHYRIFGFYFGEITAQSFTNKFGTYRGGYAPAKVDPMAVRDIQQREELEKFIQANPTFEWPASGGKGFTIGRVENFNKPLSLEIGLVVRHVDDVIRFSTVKPAVVDAAKIIMNPRFRETIANINPNFTIDLDKTVKPALNRADKGPAAVSDPSIPPILVRTMNVLKTNASMQIMVGNVVNAAEQFAGFGTALSRVDARYMMKAGFKFMSNPKAMTQMIESLSTHMKNRNDSDLFEMEKQAKNIFAVDSKVETMRDFAKKHGYFAQIFTQNFIDNIVWMAAYDQALANGSTGSQAINQADSDVRQTQGGRRAMDISQIETNQWLGFFQMFMRFFNGLANLNYANFTKLAYEDIGMKKKFAKGFYLYATGYASVAIVSGAIRKAAAGGLDADDDDEYLDDLFDVFIGSQLDLSLAMLPIAGSAIKAGANWANDKQYDDRVSASPAISALTTIVGTGTNLATGKLFDDKKQKQDVRDGLTALGIITGFPVGAANRPISYEIDRQSGKARPTGPIDAARGYVTGKPGVRD